MYRERFREMNCEKCQESLSEFLDGTLGHSEHAAVGAHLAACANCDAAREDFHAIIAVAREARRRRAPRRLRRRLPARVPRLARGLPALLGAARPGAPGELEPAHARL